MYAYLGQGQHSKKELEAMVEDSIEQINYLHSRIGNLQNSHTGNFG